MRSCMFVFMCEKLVNAIVITTTTVMVIVVNMVKVIKLMTTDVNHI